MCNENFEVETDELWNSIEQCMGVKSIGDNDEGNGTYDYFEKDDTRRIS